jgi:hypothetical protein
MIRRLRWLAIGAVIGIVGYRRLTRAGSTRFPGVFQIPAFLRDVRAGMAEYEHQHLARKAGRPVRQAGAGILPVGRTQSAGLTQPARGSLDSAGPDSTRVGRVGPDYPKVGR